MSVFYKLQRIDALLGMRDRISRLNSPDYLFHSLKNKECDCGVGSNLGIETNCLGRKVDKVFCTRWINNSTVLFGTKCGKLFQSNATATSEITTSNADGRPFPIRFIVATGQEIVCSSNTKRNCVSLFDCNQSTTTDSHLLTDIPVCHKGTILSGTFHNEFLLVGTTDGSIYRGKRTEREFCFSSFKVSVGAVRQIVPIPNSNSSFILLGYSQLISHDLESESVAIHANYPKEHCSNLECIATNESKIFVGSRDGIAMLDLRASSSSPSPIWSAKNCPELDPFHRIMGPVCMVASGDHYLTAGLASGQVMLFEERMNKFTSLLIDFSLLHNFASVFSLDYAHSYGSLAVAGGPYYEELFGNFFAFVQ